MFSKLLNFSLLAAAVLAPIASVEANPHLANRLHHSDIARRSEGHVDVYKRYSDSRWSFYNVETGNAGSCGKFHSNSDFTVAVNAAQMKSSLCFKKIRLSYGGKTTTATISDTCPGCPWGGLDLTEGLFSFFASHSVGIIYGEWDFGDAPSPPTTRAPPAPTTKWVPPPLPTTTSKTTKKTTTKKRTTTSSKHTSTRTHTTTVKHFVPSLVASSTAVSSSRVLSSSSSVTSSSTVSINYQSGAASGLAIPTGTIDVRSGESHNLMDLYSVYVQVGGIAAVANRL